MSGGVCGYSEWQEPITLCVIVKPTVDETFSVDVQLATQFGGRDKTSVVRVLNSAIDGDMSRDA